MTLREKIAELPIPGDGIVLMGGHVFYRVIFSFTNPWEGVKADRTEIDVRGCSLTKKVDVSLSTWTDLVYQGAATWTRKS